MNLQKILRKKLNNVRNCSNMTKNEAVALIRQKMKNAEKNYEIALVKREFDECSWYNGIQRGLQDALQVIGMLDNEHNRLKSSL